MESGHASDGDGDRHEGEPERDRAPRMGGTPTRDPDGDRTAHGGLGVVHGAAFQCDGFFGTDDVAADRWCKHWTWVPGNGGVSSTCAAVPMRQDEPVISALKLRVRLLWWAPVVTVFAAVSLVMFILTVTGSALIVVWVGIPILLPAMAVTRPIAQFYRRRLTHIDGKGIIESPYLAPRSGNLLIRVQALFRDPARRRDAVWLMVNGTVGLALGIAEIVEAVLDLVFWWLPPGLAG